MQRLMKLHWFLVLLLLACAVLGTHCKQHRLGRCWVAGVGCLACSQASTHVCPTIGVGQFATVTLPCHGMHEQTQPARTWQDAC